MILTGNVFHHVKRRLHALTTVDIDGTDYAVVFHQFFDASASELAPVFTCQIFQVQTGTIDVSTLVQRQPFLTRMRQRMLFQHRQPEGIHHLVVGNTNPPSIASLLRRSQPILAVMIGNDDVVMDMSRVGMSRYHYVTTGSDFCGQG